MKANKWVDIGTEPEEECLLLFYTPDSADSFILGLSDAFEDILEEDPSITHWKVLSYPPSHKEIW